MSVRGNLAKKIIEHQKQVKDWLIQEAVVAEAPFYSSIDLRDAGFKIVPVDNNLYPAGFNNICSTDQRTASHVFKQEIETLQKLHAWNPIRKIVIIPESHTTNTFYIENLYFLKTIIEEAGFEVRIGWYLEVAEPFDLTSESGKVMKAYPTEVKNQKLSVGGFEPDLILLNNDFSSGYPKKLDGLTQPILPSHKMGWHTRRKNEHFIHYNRLAKELADILGVDAWSLQIQTEVMEHVNFDDEASLQKLAAVTEKMLREIGEAYAARKIKRKPFVFIKSNTGTYGMGIMVVHDAKEVLNMNRRTKNKMAMGKNGLTTESVVIQEGVPTTAVIDKLTAEPVIYLAGTDLIGGFLRTHTERGDEENLNSKGMVFRKLCMTDLKNMRTLLKHEDDEPCDDDPETVLEQSYGMIARLSALATGLEIKDHIR